MRAPTVRELIDAWERGLSQSLVQRALTLLGVSCDPDERMGLANLSIGQRNARLLRMREALFGTRVQGLAACPSCGEKLELSVDTTDLSPPGQAEHQEQAQTDAANPTESSLDRSTAVFAVSVAGRTWRFRLPNSEDLEAVIREQEAAVRCEVAEVDAVSGADKDTHRTSPRQTLLGRCLILAKDAADPAVNQPDEQAQQAIARRMSQCDPQADMHVLLDCPACAHAWRVLFDIASFLWSEVHTWAQRTLREAHQLASVYGWFERDILAMSPLRRRMYLDMIGS